MKHKSNLTILMLTYNEANRIEFLLKRYTKFCEVIILDNFSTDGTLEIANKYNIKIINRIRPGLPTIDDLKNGANNTANEWIHIGACSEVLPEELLNCIISVTSNKETQYRGVSVIRTGYTWGELTHVYRSGSKFNSNGQIEDSFRFVKKSEILWHNSRIHYETPAILNKSQVYFLPNQKGTTIPYFREGILTKIEYKHSLYADVESDTLINEGAKFSWLKLLFSPLKHFMVMFIKRRTIAGFICAIQHAQLIMNIHLRILTRERYGNDMNKKTEEIKNNLLQ